MESFGSPGLVVAGSPFPLSGTRDVAGRTIRGRRSRHVFAMLDLPRSPPGLFSGRGGTFAPMKPAVPFRRHGRRLRRAFIHDPTSRPPASRFFPLRIVTVSGGIGSHQLSIQERKKSGSEGHCERTSKFHRQGSTATAEVGRLYGMRPTTGPAASKNRQNQKFTATLLYFVLKDIFRQNIVDFPIYCR